MKSLLTHINKFCLFVPNGFKVNAVTMWNNYWQYTPLFPIYFVLKLLSFIQILFRGQFIGVMVLFFKGGQTSPLEY